jgi:IS30 family transposase
MTACDYVLSRFRQGWSPEEISGRLPIDFPDDDRMRVSAETLYSWVYSSSMRERQLWQYLPRGHKRRRRRSARGVHRVRIRWRVGLDQRPVEVLSRECFGHGESDLVIGKNRSTGLHTTVERQSRFLQARKLGHVTASETFTAQQDIYARLPAHAVASVTVDNGSEFSHHHQLADTIGVPTYFCDPYSAWQRGTNEHVNGRLRRYFPKGTDFADVTDEELADIVHEINNRPRKVLGFATPAEIFQELRSRQPDP